MSAFSAEEIEFVRSRGNLWAQKVWLGLYDSSRLGLYDAKDDEGLRAFIIDKYEKKRYAVYFYEATCRFNEHIHFTGITLIPRPSATP